MGNTTIAKLAQGTLLKIGNGGGPEVFTLVPGCKRIGPPTTKFDLKDVTDHDDTDFFRSWIAGLSDGDTIAVRGNWRASNAIHQGIRTDNINATLRNFKIVYPDTSGNTCAFAAFIIDGGAPTADAGEVMEHEFRLKMVGAPTWS